MSATTTTGATLASFGCTLYLILVSCFSVLGAFLGGGGRLLDCLRSRSRLGYEFHSGCIFYYDFFICLSEVNYGYFFSSCHFPFNSLLGQGSA